MAHRRDFRRGAVAIRQARMTVWGFLNPVDTTITAAGGTIVASLNAAALAARPFTVIRTHWEVMLRSDQAAAIEVQSAAVGCAVVSDQAVAVGVTAVPTPVTDSGSDLWYVHKFIFGDESNLTDRTRSATRLSIDSKAMRKVNEDQDIVTVVESGAATVGAGSIISLAGRFLIKLH